MISLNVLKSIFCNKFPLASWIKSSSSSWVNSIPADAKEALMLFTLLPTSVSYLKILHLLIDNKHHEVNHL